MKVISCASYYGTGSSAVTDYVSEFQSVYSFTNEEFRFLHDPDGVDDLYFHLVENHNRHNSGHALKRFKRLVDFYEGNLLSKKYAPFFNNRWKEISYKYIDRIADFTYKGWWMYDLYDRGPFYYFIKRFPNAILHRTIWRNKPERSLNTLKGELTYCAAPSEEEFIEVTKSYIRELFFEATKDEKEIIMVDQIVPPSNLSRYTRYFEDIKVVIVDRDPRDIYLLEKMEWKDGVIPSDDVETFVKWFRYTRKHRKEEKYDPTIAYVLQFEDLVYHYDHTTKILNDFLGLSKADHIAPRSVFDPDRSKRNTRKWLDYPELADEIRYIEQELQEYLYDYSDVFVES